MKYLGNYSVARKESTLTTTPFHLNGGNYFGVAFSQQTSFGGVLPKGLEGFKKPGRGFYSTYSYWEVDNSNSRAAKKIKKYADHPETNKRKHEIHKAFGSSAPKYLWAANPYNFEWNAFYGSAGDWDYGLGVNFDPDKINSWNPRLTDGLITGNQIMVWNSAGWTLTDSKGTWAELGGKKREITVHAGTLSSIIKMEDGSASGLANQMLINKFGKAITEIPYKDLRAFSVSLPNAKIGQLKTAVGPYQGEVPFDFLFFSGGYSRFFDILYKLQTKKDKDFGPTRGEMRDRVNLALSSLNDLLKGFYKDMSGGIPVWNNYFYSHSSFTLPQLADPPSDSRVPPAYESGYDVMIPIVKLYYILVYLIMFSMPHPQNKKQQRDRWIKKLIALAPPCIDVKYTLDGDGNKQRVLNYLKTLGITDASDNITLVDEGLTGPRPFVFFRLQDPPGVKGDITARINERQGQGTLLIYGLPYGVKAAELANSFKRDTPWWEKNKGWIVTLAVAVTNTLINVAMPGAGAASSKILGKFAGKTIAHVLIETSRIALDLTRMYINKKGYESMMSAYNATREAQAMFMLVQNTGGQQEGKSSNPMDFPFDFIFWWPDWIAAQLIQSVDNPITGIPSATPPKGGGLGRFESRPPFFTWAEYYWCWMTWYLANIKVMMAASIRSGLAGIDKPIYPYVPPVWVKAFDEKVKQQQQKQAQDIQESKERIERKKKLRTFVTYGAYATAGVIALGTLAYAFLGKKKPREEL